MIHDPFTLKRATHPIRKPLRLWPQEVQEVYFCRSDPSLLSSEGLPASNFIGWLSGEQSHIFGFAFSGLHPPHPKRSLLVIKLPFYKSFGHVLRMQHYMILPHLNLSIIVGLIEFKELLSTIVELINFFHPLDV